MRRRTDTSPRPGSRVHPPLEAGGLHSPRLRTRAATRWRHAAPGRPPGAARSFQPHRDPVQREVP
ncbi:hypothetical protein B1218_39280, partial [Pseudomonas ogarae]